MFGCEEMPRKWDEEDRSNRPPRHQPHPQQLPLFPMGSIGYSRSISRVIWERSVETISRERGSL